MCTADVRRGHPSCGTHRPGTRSRPHSGSAVQVPAARQEPPRQRYFVYDVLCNRLPRRPKAEGARDGVLRRGRATQLRSLPRADAMSSDAAPCSETGQQQPIDGQNLPPPKRNIPARRPTEQGRFAALAGVGRQIGKAPLDPTASWPSGPWCANAKVRTPFIVRAAGKGKLWIGPIARPAPPNGRPRTRVSCRSVMRRTHSAGPAGFCTSHTLRAPRPPAAPCDTGGVATTAQWRPRFGHSQSPFFPDGSWGGLGAAGADSGDEHNVRQGRRREDGGVSKQ